VGGVPMKTRTVGAAVQRTVETLTEELGFDEARLAALRRKGVNRDGAARLVAKCDQGGD
jgi:hypothetical protein